MRKTELPSQNSTTILRRFFSLGAILERLAMRFVATVIAGVCVCGLCMIATAFKIS